MSAATVSTTPAYVAIERDDQYGWAVHPIWPNVDRPYVGGIVMATRYEAERVARAMRDGAWYVAAYHRTDVDGRTYIHAEAATIGKYAIGWLDEHGY